MVDMRPCPKCGSPNSAQKRVCFNCRAELMPAANASTAPVRAASAGRIISPIERAKSVPRQQPLVRIDLRMQYYRQLYTQLHAGIPPAKALDFIVGNVAPSLRKVVSDLATQTSHGGMLSAAMERHPQVFPEWEVAAVHAGEVSGNLAEAVEDVVETLEVEWQFRTRMKSRTLHMRIVFNFGIVVALMVLASHRIVEAKETNGFEALSHFFAGVMIGILISIVTLQVLKMGWIWMTRDRRWAPFTLNVMRRTPLLGPIVTGMLRHRFTRVLATLWRAGVPPLQAIETAVCATDDPLLYARMEPQLQAYAAGGTLGEVLAATCYFTPDVAFLIRTGEESGEVPYLLRTLAGTMRDELDGRIKTAPLITTLGLLAVISPLVGWLYIHTWQWFYHMVIDGTWNAMMGK